MKIENEFDLDPLHLAKLISTLWEAGVDVDWRKWNQAISAQKISLPLYPFEKVRYWFEEEHQKNSVENKTNAHKIFDIHVTSYEETTKLIRTIVKEVLNVGSVNIEDNFFRLGGDFIQIIQIVSRINVDFNVNIPLEEVYHNPNIVTLTDLVMKNKVKE